MTSRADRKHDVKAEVDGLVAVYRETIEPLYAFVAPRTGGSTALAEDVTQETYLRAIATWRADGLPNEPLAWLKTVARNLLLSHFRRRRPTVIDAAVIDAVLDDGPTSLPSAASMLQRGLTRLPRRRAALLKAFHLDARNVRAIAEELGVSEPAVEGRLHRARNDLRRVLGPLLDRKEGG